MKGIYLTKEGKQEIEDEIQSLLRRHKEESNSSKPIEAILYSIKSKVYTYKEILSSATILPVEKSWDEVEFCHEYALEDLQEKYPNGVIIQSKTD